jgi:threonine aldolase
MNINLISDTVTRPTAAMLEAMMQAQVGDDVFGADPSVNALETKVAALFGHEAALFCPSGTMTNQIAIKCHTQPLDEMIVEENSHVYQYESAGFGFHSGISLQLIKGQHGIMSAEQIASLIRPVHDWLPISKLVVVENTVNRAGGNYYTLEQLVPISQLCRSRGLAIHLDGARIFNALCETGDTPAEIGALFDSVSVCLSKGLGAPVGSVLTGSSEFIRQARRVRKVFGGGMRQAGYLAAAGMYALDHHVERLKVDHMHAQLLAASLSTLPIVTDIRPVKTNIVIFDLDEKVVKGNHFIEMLKQKDVLVSGFGPQTIRMVTHLDVSSEQIDYVGKVLKSDFRGFKCLKRVL